MDYRQLLQKYMQLVLDNEGTTFVMYADTAYTKDCKPAFTEEEIKLLADLDRRVS